MAVTEQDVGMAMGMGMRLLQEFKLPNYAFCGGCRGQFEEIARGESGFMGLAERHALDLRALRGSRDAEGPFTDYDSYRECTMLSRCLGVAGHAFKNRWGISDDAAMKEVAGTLMVSALAGLAAKGYVPGMSPDGFRELHKILFGSWFPWAGEFRTCDIRADMEDPYPEELGVPWQEIPGSIDAAMDLYGNLPTDGRLSRDAESAVWLGLTRPRPFLFGGRETASVLLGLDMLRRRG